MIMHLNLENAKLSHQSTILSPYELLVTRDPEDKRLTILSVPKERMVIICL